MPYVDLFRRFRDLTQEELEAPELLASLNHRSFMSADGWPELLQCPRVLLLAEAGSGKTQEMREQAARLVVEGKPAFFVPLESLGRERFTEIISPHEEKAFARWKVEDQSTAWFFLDAVDELKLTHGKLENALRRLAREIDGLLHRAHVVISCRPYDWRPSLDMATFQAKLPFTPRPTPLRNADDTFLAALRERGKGRGTGEKKMAVGSPRTVVLLPLSEQQIGTLARSLGVADPTAFLEELRQRDALTFARRPLDLIDLVTTWKANGRLGTRAEQHEANVSAKLKDDPDRQDRGILSAERARSGAERLALALALTRARTIRSPEQALDADRAEGVLDPAAILVDWTEEQRQTLLRRALFDPATYGRIRFHHRSVQEYLAACRLRELREHGMPVKCLGRLLFAERYGVPLVLPSMQAIAAWLAMWDDFVRRELMAREPETLLSMGDPESLPISARAQLLRAFTEAYGEGGWRGFNIPIGDVRRLAHSELACVVRELWNAKPTSPDVSELLLEIIWEGRIKGCADIATLVAFDIAQSDYQREIAIKALVACDKIEVMREISDSILHEPAKWPGSIVETVVGELFPSVLSVAELIVLIERAHEVKKSIHGFSWAVDQIVEEIEPLSDVAVELQDALADLVWRGRHEEQEWYHLRSRFDRIAPVLAKLCSRRLEARPPMSLPDTCHIWACAVANRFGKNEGGVRDSVTELKKHFETCPMLREAAFWSEIRLMSEAARAENARDWYFRAEHDSLIERLTVDDRPWLLEALRSSRFPDHRLISLHALLSLWRFCGRSQVELNELSESVKSDSDLTTLLLRGSAPPERDQKYEKLQRRERRLGLVREGRERQRLERWHQWRKELLAEPEAAFTAERLPITARNLYQWLDANQSSGTRFNVWDAAALREAFGDEIAARAEKAFQTTWRARPPTLLSQRPTKDRNSTLYVWCEGLTGLAAEATAPGWATRLTPDEARIAATYATIEINGFPSWLQDIAASHPSVVDDVIGGELIAELALEQEHSRTLQNLSYADSGLKRLLTPRFLTLLPDWPSTFRDKEHSNRSVHHLDQVLSILSDVAEGQERVTVAEACERQFSKDSVGPQALVWLRGLFRFDPERAAQALEDCLADLPEQERSTHAVATFANLFGDRATHLAFSNDAKRAITLGCLVRWAYRYVRPDEDQEHEGVYTPDIRDQAERARDSLLVALIDTSGAEARKIVLDLAADPVFAHFPDRLRFLARRRAASDAEGMALRPEEVIAIESRYEAPPHDRDGLFTVMMDRLNDLAHDIAHDDFTDRRTLRTIQEEIEMQRNLARRLREAAKGAYMVSREDEVADLKKTDIRLVATRGEQKAVIEVKIAGRWTLTQLEDALRGQLVGLYLRHDTCRAGCLLLTYEGKKKHWQHPVRRTRLKFMEVIEYLRCAAQAIEQDLGYKICLGVCPLDLTDPPSERSRALIG